MIKQEMNDLMFHIFEEVTRIRNAGQSEYARNLENVFANFERVANSLDIPCSSDHGSVDIFRDTQLDRFKHVDGLCAYADGHKSQREDVRGRLTDIIVYSILFWGMVVDNEKQGEDNG